MLSLALRDYPLVGWYILVLVFLEGLLSADNALVLALMVRHLPKDEQKRVLRYGIWGAVGFRLVAVLLSAILIRFWYFKVFGGLYLLYLSIAHFLSRKEQNANASEAAGGVPGLGKQRWLRGFWGTVTSVTMADIAFSIDSILAAVALAVGFPERFGPNGKMFIVFIGGVLGIITMRFVVRYFVTMLDRFPGLAEGAYYLVAWIGLKLVVSGIYDAKYIPHHIPEWLFWTVMLAIAIISIFVKPGGVAPDHSESLDLLESEAESDDERPSDSGRATNGDESADRSHGLRRVPISCDRDPAIIPRQDKRARDARFRSTGRRSGSIEFVVDQRLAQFLKHARFLVADRLGRDAPLLGDLGRRLAHESVLDQGGFARAQILVDGILEGGPQRRPVVLVGGIRRDIDRIQRLIHLFALRPLLHHIHGAEEGHSLRSLPAEDVPDPPVADFADEGIEALPSQALKQGCVNRLGVVVMNLGGNPRTIPRPIEILVQLGQARRDRRGVGLGRDRRSR